MATGSASASLSALGTNMSIGVKTNNATTAPDPGAPGWWDGRIDDLAFFDNVLTPAEVLQIKNNGDAGIGVTVPEPASAGLLVLGMFGLVRRRR